ncbi:hypothetical protein ACHAXH_002843 [Discostella pseudostelligera]
MGRTITEPCWTPNGGFPYYKRFLILEFGRTTCTSSIGVGYSQLSPQLITAEIEQMDAIANLSIEQYIFFNGCIIHFCNHQRQLLRKVRQSASYTEPSTKSKLCRSDVLFKRLILCLTTARAVVFP